TGQSPPASSPRGEVRTELSDQRDLIIDGRSNPDDRRAGNGRCPGSAVDRHMAAWVPHVLDIRLDRPPWNDLGAVAEFDKRLVILDESVGAGPQRVPIERAQTWRD